MVVVYLDAVVVVAGFVFYDVVGEVRFGNFVVGVNDNLGESRSRGLLSFVLVLESGWFIKGSMVGVVF